MNRAIQSFKDHKGILKTSQAVSLGIAPRTLYAMRDAGLVRQLSRGVYQLAELDAPGNPDLLNIALRVPKAVICLISALHCYGLGTQVPHKVYIALPQSAEKPRLDFPLLDIVWLSEKSYSAGITHQIVDDIPIKIYTREKTIADCIKFRNKIGIDVALEAIKDYIKLPDRQIDQLLHYAKIDRVEGLISRYLEALT